MTIVDVHCHLFNADDLPIRGFLEHMHLGTSDLARLLATLVERLLQGSAPGYEEDMARIRSLLAGSQLSLPQLDPQLARSLSATASGIDPVVLDAEAEARLSALAASDPVFVTRLSAALEDGLWSESTIREGVRTADVRDSVLRAVRWALLFGLSRLDLSAELVRNFSDQVDLYCPLLVEMGLGLGEQPQTSARQRMELMEGISILSMKGLLPGGGTARLHPFIGFDPRRQVHAQVGDIVETPLQLVQSAVLRHGFVGVKVYPSMGWRPIGNRATDDMTAREAELIDIELRRFYSWCQDNDVPITTHANTTVSAAPAFDEFAGPDGWADVLAEFPRLHLNFAHFGGAWADMTVSDWPAGFARVAVAHEFVYADVSDHQIYDPAVTDSYFPWLGALFADPDTALMRERLQFGSDWFMLAMYPEHERFLEEYRSRYLAQFGEDASAKFLGGNALRFLGFDSAANANAARLLERYRIHAPDRVPKWLGTPER
jgi:predicted TIM-barrel fold metal-dependent hydrolase